MTNRTMKLHAGPGMQRVEAEHRKFIDAIDAAEDERHAVTWLNDATGKPVAAIVPVPVAERGLYAQAQLAYARMARGETTPTEEQARVIERVVRSALPAETRPVNVARLAVVVDSLISVGVITSYQIGLPWYSEAESGDRQDAIERWLRS
jgi:hypothetical protein